MNPFLIIALVIIASMLTLFASWGFMGCAATLLIVCLMLFVGAMTGDEFEI